jgi:predicted kinase
MDEDHIRSLIPKGKTENVDELRTLSFEEIQPIANELLEWCVDPNWPIASEIGRIFSGFGPQTAPLIRHFLATHNADDSRGVLSSISSTAIWHELRDLLDRIAGDPTLDERFEELDVIASHKIAELDAEPSAIGSPQHCDPGIATASDGPNETRPFVVLVSGAPGSGKTTLGWELSRVLHVPFLSRDDIKTGLHVTHYSDNPAETLRFSIRAFETFFGTAQSLLEAGVSMVIEAAFHAGVSEPSIAELASHAEIAHIALTTDPATALHRYRERALAGLRHPAHDDIRYADEMASGRKDVGVYQLDIPYPTLLVNGADGWNPPLTEMAEFVRQNRNKK